MTSNFYVCSSFPFYSSPSFVCGSIFTGYIVMIITQFPEFLLFGYKKVSILSCTFCSSNKNESLIIRYLQKLFNDRKDRNS